MKLTRNQIIILSAVGVLVLAGLLALILPGFKKTSTLQVKANLQFWGLYDTIREYEKPISDFKALYPDVEVRYRGFSNEEDYQTALVNALAAGTGPDVFMVRNLDLFRDKSKIAPVPATKFSILTLRNLFPQIVESDFAPDSKDIYGLPLSIDSLALIYNQDLFNAAGVTAPPKTWTEFESIIPRLVKKSAGRITRAAAAIGGSAKSMETSPDLLSLLMFQSGATMLSRDRSSAVFASADGEEALNYYLRYSNPKDALYTWSDDMKKAREAFVAGETAIIFDYWSSLTVLRARNKSLNIGVAEMPQPDRAGAAVTFGNYWAYTVSRQSRYQNIAWDFILNLTAKNGTVQKYIAATNKPPALRVFINQALKDPTLTVFAKQALTARAWPEIDYNKTSGILSDAIGDVLTGRRNFRDALRTAQDRVTELLQKTI